MKRLVQSINNKKSETNIIDLSRYDVIAQIFWLPIRNVFDLDANRIKDYFDWYIGLILYICMRLLKDQFQLLIFEIWSNIDNFTINRLYKL